MTPRSTVRIGIVGAGSVVASRHLPNLKRCPNVEVTAICRRDPTLLARIAEMFDVPRRYTAVEHLLEDTDLDAVVIASPAGLHARHVRAALDRGLHVFVEKPFVLDPIDGEALVDQAARTGRVLAVGVDRRGNGGYRYARHVVERGELGDVRHVTWSLAVGLMPILRGEPGDRAIPRMPGTHSQPDLAGGGILINVGTHVLDAALWLTGRLPKRVTTVVGSDGLPVETRASLVAQLEGNVLLDCSCEANAPGDWSWDEHGIIYGAEGSITLSWPPRAETPAVHRRHDGSVVEVSLPTDVNPMENFVAAIRGEERPLATGADALATVRLIAAAYQSAREGRTIDV